MDSFKHHSPLVRCRVTRSHGAERIVAGFCITSYIRRSSRITKAGARFYFAYKAKRTSFADSFNLSWLLT
jgi:hypothetical protein